MRNSSHDRATKRDYNLEYRDSRQQRNNNRASIIRTPRHEIDHCQKTDWQKKFSVYNALDQANNAKHREKSNTAFVNVVERKQVASSILQGERGWRGQESIAKYCDAMRSNYGNEPRKQHDDGNDANIERCQNAFFAAAPEQKHEQSAISDELSGDWMAQ